MEDYALDVMIGKGPSARSLRLSLKPFTVVGATTRAGRISSPLRDRFGATYRLDFYTEAELAAIVERSATILDVTIDAAATLAIARRGRGTPRIVNRLLKRVRDHAQVHGDGQVDEATATAAMRAMEIDDEGLDSTDRKLLAAIIQKFALGAGRRRGACRRPVRGDRDDRGRLRAVPAAPRVHRSNAVRADRDRPRAGAPVRPWLRDPAAAPAGSGHARPVGRRRATRAEPTDRRRATPGPTIGAAARSRSRSPPPADGSTRARPGRLTLTHGVVETPQFMPVGTNATVKALSPDDIRDVGRLDHPGQHLPPLPAARARADRATRRAAPVHGLGRPDPDRLGRLPGRLARRSAGRRRGRRHVPEPPRRSVHGSRRSTRSRVQEALGSDVAVAFDQPVMPSSPRAVVADATDADASLGGAVAGGAHAARTRRCSASSRAGWIRSCGRSRRGSSPTCRSTGSASAAWPATRRRRSATRRSTSPCRCSPTIRGRAT